MMTLAATAPPVALITGAAGVLGREIALELAVRGYQLVLTDLAIDNRPAEWELQLTTTAQHPPLFAVLDVTQAESWDAIHKTIRERFGRLDVLINAAGILAVGEYPETSWQQSQAVLRVNLEGTMLGCHTLYPLLHQAPGGAHVINIASYAGFVALPWCSAYNASKAAVIAFTETLHNEWAKTDIRVTVVCPGFFQSGLLAAVSDPVIQDVVEHIIDKSPLTARQVAKAIAKSLTRYRLYVVVPSYARSAWYTKRLAPVMLLKAVSRKAHQMRERFGQRRQSGRTGSTESS